MIFDSPTPSSHFTQGELRFRSMPEVAQTSESFDVVVDSDPDVTAPAEETDGTAAKEESSVDSFEKQEILMLGKLRRAEEPYIALAASSYASAAPMAVGNVPSQSLLPLFGSRISATHFPQVLCRTPL